VKRRESENGNEGDAGLEKRDRKVEGQKKWLGS
jgi:hypothetical protein